MSERVRQGRGSAQIGNQNAETHGLNVLKAAVKRLGSRAVDRRTRVGKELVRWRSEIAADLGGEANISAQQRAILDLAVPAKLMLGSVDAWLLAQPTLVNGRKRCLYPIVMQRIQLADSLARYMTQLGLERRVRKIDLPSAFAGMTE